MGNIHAKDNCLSTFPLFKPALNNQIIPSRDIYCILQFTDGEIPCTESDLIEADISGYAKSI